MHELNLLLYHTCRAIAEDIDFFNMLETLYSFFTCSLVNHHKFTDMQVAGSWIGAVVQHTLGMQDLVGKCSGSYNPSAINCLTTINASVAVGLKVNSHQSTFQDLFSVTTGFHNFLQKESIDLAQAVADLYARTKGLCKANHIDIQGPSDRGQRLVDMKQLATSLVDAENAETCCFLA